jgi:hypothetical protein
MNIKEKLEQLDACEDALKWVNDRTIEQAVADCHRGDWLLWLASKLGIDKRKLTLAKGHCANTVRDLMKDPRSIAAVDAAIAYGEGKIGEEELAAARDSATDAYDDAAVAAASYATWAANSAAWAVDVAAYVADYNYDAVAAAWAAARAAYAAAWAAADYAAVWAANADADSAAAPAAARAYAAYAASVDGRKDNEKQTADICRKYIGDLIIQKFKQL